MKVAIIINTSWNIYNFRRGIIEHYLGLGDEVLAIGPRDEYSQKLEDLGCQYFELPMSGSGMNPLKDLILLYQHWNLLRKIRPDVVLTYTIKPNIYGSIASGWLGIPCICNVSGLGTVFLWKGWVKKVASALYTYAFKKNSWVFFQNEDDRIQFLEAVNLDRNKTGILPGSGINIERFAYSKPEFSETPIFLMIARLLIDKGVYEYAEAAEKYLSDGRKGIFWLIGEKDPEHKRSIDLAKLSQWEKAGTLKYFEKVEDVREIILKSEVVVLPSYREGTPRTLLEGAAMGRALIATDVPGCREVVEHNKNGFLCSVKSGKSLYEALSLYADLAQSKRIELSKYSRIKVEKEFDENIVITRYAEKIGELTNNKLKRF
ncbi:MAG: glycosyltransferase family 4 protein [Cyclobacteriaceae bacterium]